MEPPVLYKSETKIAPLSYAQERLWFLDQLQPGSSAYNIPLALRLIGHLNVAALEQSVSVIIKRHEVLRTSFSIENDQPVQRINPAGVLALQQMDISEMPEKQREAEARRLLSEDASRPFDLARGTLLRATLIRLKQDEYILLLTMHHIVSDGWSMGILYRELSVLYEAFSKGKTSPLPDLPIQYADFAVWQRQWFQGERLEKQLNFWKEELRNISTLDLPADHPRPAVQTFRGARHTLQFPQGMAEALKDLSRREGVTLFMTLLAAFQSLLHRYTGQDDIIVGSPIANRIRREIEGLIGFFVNTLVMRTDTSGNPAFSELLKRVRKAALDTYAHHDLPFENLVEELQPERDLSRNPLFQVMFTLQNAFNSHVELFGLAVSNMELEDRRTRLDLEVHLKESSEGLKGIFIYNIDLFDAATIERMAVHYQRILEGIISNPDQRLSEFPLLTGAERHQLIVEWNDTKADYSRDKCIHELFEEQVERSPDATALIFEHRQLTYGELNKKANQLAHYLRKQGVGPEVLVGICIERSMEMVIGILGILKAGGAYVPLDPAYPIKRIEFMIHDTKLVLLLTQKHLVEKLHHYKRRAILLDADRDSIARESDKNPVSSMRANSLAYIIYTSGSTGKPKGVLLEHRGLSKVSEIQRQVFQLRSGDRVLQFASISFDASIFEIVMALQGSSLCLAKQEKLLPGLELIRTLQDLTITIVTLPPSALALLTDEGLDDLRIVAVAGEVCSAELAGRWAVGKRFFNLYGPTEASIWSTAVEYRDNGLSLPIGRPISNTKTYILDQYLNPVPVGHGGELYIGGDGLARGYLNQSELTIEKFIPDPFSNKPEARLYRTGDMARYLPDGNIEYLGRIDHQVKIRGFRIEPGEIEAVLGQHPDVRGAVVIAREDRPGDRRLTAYVVLDNKSAVTIPELRSFLKEKLPDYMVPSAFVALDSIPVTPSGKVDRKALTAPDSAWPDMDEAFVEPRTPLETRIAGVWSDVLGLDRVGVHDNFFELGGHSLLATQAMSRLSKDRGDTIPLAILFQHPTIARLAEYLSRENGQPHEAVQDFYTLYPIQTSGTRAPFFWIHSQMISFLPKYLGQDQPLYAIIAQGVDGKRVRYKTMKEIIAHYLREIRAVQPTGPYFLGGFCWGARYAFEIAQQLLGQREDVGLLFVVEPALSPVHLNQTFIDKLYPRLRRHRWRLSRLPLSGKIRYVLQIPFSKLHYRRIVSEVYLKTGRPMSPLLSVQYALDVIMGTYRDFVQNTYPKEIVLIQAETGNHPTDSDWSKLAEGGFKVHVAQGTTHMDLLEEPGAGFWAELLNRYLRKAQAKYADKKV